MGANTGGAAFPCDDLVVQGNFCPPSQGMTLRDYFAAKALQGILPTLHEGIRPDDLPALADDAYAMADSMLAARGNR